MQKFKTMGAESPGLLIPWGLWPQEILLPGVWDPWEISNKFEYFGKCTGLNLPAGWCRAGQLMGSAHGRPAAARGGGWTHQDLHRLFPATHLQAQHTPSKKKDKNRRKGKGQRFCLVAECIQFLAVLSVLPWMIWIIWWMTPGWFERKGWIHPILLLELFNRWIKKNS